MANVSPGRIQVAFDLSITQATSPMVVYTVAAGVNLYLDYLNVTAYAGTWATATPGFQVVVDQGVSGVSCAIMRNYVGVSYVYTVSFAQPIIVTTNIQWACLLNNAAAAFSAFFTIGGIAA